jgi:hypothetical protein
MMWLSILSVVFSTSIYAQATPICVEDKHILFSEFILQNFDDRRTEVGIDQTQVLKSKVKTFIDANPTLVITDVAVSSSSSKVPLYLSIGGRKIIDPKSEARSLALAQDRAHFAARALMEIKNSNSALAQTKFSTSADLSGPDFTPKDLNNRFVTKQTPQYEKQVKALFDEFKSSFEEGALIKSETDLLDESRFSNLYQAKYKPFQGFRVVISGFKKCVDKKVLPAGSSSPSGKNQ